MNQDLIDVLRLMRAEIFAPEIEDGVDECFGTDTDEQVANSKFPESWIRAELTRRKLDRLEECLNRL